MDSGSLFFSNISSPEFGLPPAALGTNPLAGGQPSSGWASIEALEADEPNAFVIDETPRHGILGSTEVTMEGFNRVVRLSWRPAVEYIVDDAALESFLRSCKEEHGETVREEQAGRQCWRWTDESHDRELVATRGAADGQYALCYTEAARPGANDAGIALP